ncbi:MULTISPECIES: HAD-IA family hydrolase [Pseudomonas]|uniref:HAD family hydrolase n=2 Tax=Pseudomonas TaxID=286 RepID=A0A4Y9TCQ5_PSEFL|nr:MULTISPECIES: HAD-IA family hydrolase [Pseudomonas]CRM97615.1 Pyrophosphatase PpaX [Pseudomonas sp. 22 E 5]MCX9154273.1 HAD-IA family hydrolase [Pseudomonas sp. TB1-B1]QXH66228.1 HAD-IA family hydrolase [Pseudomonas asgharzadehiana]TFW40862.1 HAD family hydrolase [Pseudomonas fluorescens]TKJ56027.1 HAD family hydrolase [Pseudomonas sp. CFBP13506]
MSHLDYKLLIFDWDGTLANSIGRIVESMHVASTRSGFALCSDLAVKGIIGLGLPEAIRTLYPEITDPELITFREHYADHYIALEAEPSPLFEGVVQSLDTFRAEGYYLAVATGKARRGLDRVLRAHGWEDYFDITRAADETASKPHPLMLEQILAHCGVSARQALMVGDASFDLMMARNAGMDSVAVSYGAQSAEALQPYEPRVMIDHFSQLQAWLSRAR